MDWSLLFEAYGLVLIAIAFGAFVARATGVGFALVVVAALLALPQMDQPTALYVAAPLSLLNLSFVLAALHRRIPWSTLQQIALPLALGFAGGLIFGLYLPKVWMLICGLIIVAYTLFSLVRPPQPGARGAMARSDLGGGLTGLMTGALSFPGPPLSGFLLARGFIGDPVRATIALVGCVGAGVRLLIGEAFAYPIPAYWPLMIVGSGLILAGNILGGLAAKRMSARTHRILIILMTLLAFVQLSWGLYGEVRSV